MLSDLPAMVANAVLGMGIALFAETVLSCGLIRHYSVLQGQLAEQPPLYGVVS